MADPVRAQPCLGVLLLAARLRPSGTTAAYPRGRATANSRPPRMSYLVLALPAAVFSAAAMAEGSAKAITASPSVKL
jgi:hypothetical protein